MSIMQFVVKPLIALFIVCILSTATDAASQRTNGNSKISSRNANSSEPDVIDNTATIDTDVDWTRFKKLFRKKYADRKHEEFRWLLWQRRVRDIDSHNRRAARGEVSFRMAVNKFADLTEAEISDTMFGLNVPQDVVADITKTKEEEEEVSVFRATETSAADANGTSVADTNSSTSNACANANDVHYLDWRDRPGVVSPVEDQGWCASCYVFSATGALEGQMALRHNKSLVLSEQDIIDCSYDYGNLGCAGGLMNYCFNFTKDKGVCNDTIYPATQVSSTCARTRPPRLAIEPLVCKGFKNIPRGNESALIEALQTIGPISVGMDGSPISFSYYESGIYCDDACSSTKLNHAVLLIGFGTECNAQSGNIDYWIIKNSWGDGWGENGFMRICRQNNTCGVMSLPSYPVI